MIDKDVIENIIILLEDGENKFDYETSSILMTGIYGKTFLDNENSYIELIRKIQLYQSYINADTQPDLNILDIITDGIKKSYLDLQKKDMPFINLILINKDRNINKNSLYILQNLRDIEYPFTPLKKVTDFYEFSQLSSDRIILEKHNDAVLKQNIILPIKKMNEYNETSKAFYDNKPYLYEGNFQLSFNVPYSEIYDIKDDGNNIEIGFFYTEYIPYYLNNNEIDNEIDPNESERVAYIYSSDDKNNNSIYKIESKRNQIKTNIIYLGNKNVKLIDPEVRKQFLKFPFLVKQNSKKHFLQIGTEEIVVVDFSQHKLCRQIKNIDIKSNASISNNKEEEIKEKINYSKLNYSWEERFEIINEEITFKTYMPIVTMRDNTKNFYNGKYDLAFAPLSKKVICIGSDNKYIPDNIPDKVIFSIKLDKLGTGEIESINYEEQKLEKEPMDFFLKSVVLNQTNIANTKLEINNNIFSIRNSKNGELNILKGEEGFYSISEPKEKSSELDAFLLLNRKDISIIKNKYLEENELNEEFILTKHRILFFDKDKKMLPFSFLMDYEKTKELNNTSILIQNNENTNYVNFKGEKCSIVINKTDSDINIESIIVKFNAELINNIKRNKSLNLNF